MVHDIFFNVYIEFEWVGTHTCMAHIMVGVVKGKEDPAVQ